ncbi:MAG: ribbon-helix-helix domain-containing protein [Candidatus Bathyarchaeia archaeon]
MKSIRISDEVHQKLTSILGQLMAQTGKIQTYQDAIENMLNNSLLLPPELLVQIEKFIEKNKHLGFTTKEEFIRDAARWRLEFLNKNSEYVEIPRDKYEKLETAFREMNAPYRGAFDFIHSQIDEVLEKYDRWLREKQEQIKKPTKRRLSLERE